MVSLTVRSAGRPSRAARALPVTLDFSTKDWSSITVGDVKARLRRKFPSLSPARQKLSLENDRKALEDEKTLAAVGVSGNGVLLLKDLGPQISWRTVFMTEYVGPLLIHPFFFHFPEKIYRFYKAEPLQHSALQKVVYVLVMLHFLKRELETIFVHRFSHSTMPLRNIFRNSAHYWLVSGVLMALVLYSPTYSAPALKGSITNSYLWLISWTAVWVIAEASNFSTHMTLASLRPPGTRTRGIPTGYGFDWVSCPNYFFETIAWLAITCMTKSSAVLLFLAIGTYQMSVWALKKHRAYKKEFGERYPRGRKAMFPFVF